MMLLLAALGLFQGEIDTTLFAATRTAVASFADARAALAAGYRPLGPDAPGMGRHYVNPLLVMRGTVTPDRPQALSYAQVGDSLVLVAVAWIVPLKPGDSSPDIPGTEGQWHQHTGAIAEEGNLFGHAMHRVEGGRGGVAMLHAWIGLANPAGPFAPDNWRLPFFRHGLATPRQPTDAEAKALGLVDDREGFYASQLPAAGMRIQIAAEEIAKWLHGRPPGTTLTEGDLAFLATSWTRIMKEAGH